MPWWSNITVVHVGLAGEVRPPPPPEPPPEEPHFPPLDLTLDNDRILEQQPAGTLIGRFTTEDPDNPGDSHEYTLAPGEGDLHNGSFFLEGNALRSAEVFDFFRQDRYRIRIETRDSQGHTLQQSFTVRVMDIPDQVLTHNIVPENQDSGTWVGYLEVPDPVPGYTYRFALTPGEGDADNPLFRIEEPNVLATGDAFDVEERDTYSIRVEVEDSEGTSFERIYTIQVIPQSIYVQEVYLGWRHACTLGSDGRVECWGWNNFGQTAVPEDLTLSRLSAGDNHNCGLDDAGRIVCWGSNDIGQLLAPGGNFRQVSAGSSHNCALRDNGSVECWGYDYDGQTEAPGGAFRQLDAGGFHTCGIREDGSLACWGWNNFGQTDAPPGSDYRQVSCGDYHTCARKLDDSVVCWGKNVEGQATPPEGIRLRSVSAAENHTCGLRPEGSIECWGDNREEQLTVSTDTDYIYVEAGGYTTCGVKLNGTLQCWGRNEEGQGTPPAAPPNRRPVDIEFTLNPGLPLVPTPVFTQFGQFDAVDLDPDDIHAFNLIAGDGDADNHRFRIEGDTLVNVEELDLGEYSILVEADDGHNGKRSKIFVLAVR